MKLQGEHHFQAPRKQVWEAVLDPKVLTASMPGLHRLDPIGEHEYEGALEIEVGSVQADFQGTLKLSDLEPPSSYRFSINGMGASGLIDGDGMLVLEESGAGTRVHFALDTKVGGRLAGVGESVLDSSARLVAQQTLEGLERHFGHPTPVDSAPELAITSPDAASEDTPEEILEVPAEKPPLVETAPSVEEATKIEKTAVGETVVTEPPAESSEKKPAAKTAQPPAISNSETPAITPKSSNSTQYGSQVAKGRLDDFLPTSRRPFLLGAAVIVYTVVVVLLTRACS